MFKKELRKEFLIKRQLLTKEEIHINSFLIFEKLAQKFDLKNTNICTFFPIISKNEIDTFQLFELKEKLDFNIFGTKWNINSNELSIHRIIKKDDLITSKFQIPEPVQTIKSENEQIISIVLIPLLCFDKNGNRVGYGKGVYDNFLIKFNQKKTRFIGLSLFDPIDKITDINEYDVKLHYCITPKTIYQFEE